MSGSSAKGTRPRAMRYHRALASTSDTRSCTCESPVIGAPSPGSMADVTLRILTNGPILRPVLHPLLSGTPRRALARLIPAQRTHPRQDVAFRAMLTHTPSGPDGP